VGTVSIEKSERLARALEKRGVPHEVLNAKLHEREAEIVAGAGQREAVTIATNMAGRGTDIVLGDGVPDLGGLYIIGTERHESRRIDNQLRGRAGRQGDPGETRFFLSFEDDLMRVFGGDRMRGLMGHLGLDEDTPIESGMVSRQIEGAQSRVEGFNFDNRRYVVEFDDVVNRQREIIYQERDRILEGIDTRANLSEWIADVVRELVDLHCHGKHKQEWELEALWERLRFIVPFPPAEEVELEQLGDTPAEVADTVIQEAERLYTEREKTYSPEIVRQVEVQLMLGLIDERWADYLTTLEHLKDNIRWQSLGQRDPLVEFKAEAFSAFQGFQESLKQEIVRYLFHSQIQVEPVPAQAREGIATHPDAGSVLDGPGPSAPPDSPGPPGPQRPTPPTSSLGPSGGGFPAVGRNALCPCGSGKKYKRCHGATG